MKYTAWNITEVLLEILSVNIWVKDKSYNLK